MNDQIKLGDLLTGKVEEIDRETYDDCVKKGWLPNLSDLAERKAERDDNWGENPDPDDSKFADWSRSRK